MVPLSVLDLATVAEGSTPADALADTTRLARVVERLGYRRIWVAEHHAMPAVASSAPAVLVGHLADATTTLRVGAGGVMLPNHAPLVIAEQYATLEALHPGRIDLGLGRAPGTDQVTARALRRVAQTRTGHLPAGRGGAHRLPGRQRRSRLPPGPGARTRLPPRAVAARVLDLQRPAGRPARTPLLVRLPLRPRSPGPGRRAVPEDLPPLLPAGRALRHAGRIGAVRPDRRGGPVAGRSLGPHHPAAPDRAARPGALPRAGCGLPVHRPGAGVHRRHHGHPPDRGAGVRPGRAAGTCRPGPVPTRSCCRPGPTPWRRGSSPSPWWPAAGPRAATWPPPRPPPPSEPRPGSTAPGHREAQWGRTRSAISARWSRSARSRIWR